MDPDVEEEILFNDDSGNSELDEDAEITDDDDDDDHDFVAMEAETSTVRDRIDDDHFQYEVLTADSIVQHMVDCIKEVNAVVQVCNNDTNAARYVIMILIQPGM